MLYSLCVQGSDGVWRQALGRQDPGGPYTLQFNSSSGGSASLTDVLFGDVYLCGGQVSDRGCSIG